MHNCPLCGTLEPQSIFTLPDAPAFQNKTYATPDEAADALTASLDLVQCKQCGFVWNRHFDPSIMEYDEQYQNEQGHSAIFQDYLQSVMDIIKSQTAPGDSVVEVGCGKALFLSMLRDEGYDVAGFDPAYEGNDPDVTCEYFDASLDFPPASMVILRHTLEHVPSPLEFLHTIRDANGGKGKVFIEVPCYNWIVGKKAFWDMFHEHCNYFTAHSLGSMFTECETGAIFGGQYLYLVADFESLKDRVENTIPNQLVDPNLFSSEIGRLQAFVQKCDNCLIWGAGAKGAAFSHLTDPEQEHIKAVIDINPRKQGRFLGKTGHPVLGPEALDRFRGCDIIIMNENYREEIRQSTLDFDVRLHTLGDI